MPPTRQPKTPTLSVPIARAGPITDFQLDRIIRAGAQLQNGHQPSESDLALILITTPQISAELLQRRRAMGVIADMTDMDNVTFLPCNT